MQEVSAESAFVRMVLPSFARLRNGDTDICSVKCPKTYCWKALCKILLLIPPGGKCSWDTKWSSSAFPKSCHTTSIFLPAAGTSHLLSPWRGKPSLSPRQVDQVNLQIFLFPGSLCYSEVLNREPELCLSQTAVVFGVRGTSTSCLLGA